MPGLRIIFTSVISRCGYEDSPLPYSEVSNVTSERENNTVFVFVSGGLGLGGPYLHPVGVYKRVDVRPLVSSAAVQLSPVSFSPQAWCRCYLSSLTTLSILMFSKAVLTFLAIGALWVNVSAAPVRGLDLSYELGGSLPRNPFQPLRPAPSPIDQVATATIPGSAGFARELPRSFRSALIAI